MTWQRARKPDQKAERIEAILMSAAKLFDSKELSEISMRDVAQSAGLGKASLYHYFQTKEQVFISLYRSELDEWLEDVESRLRRLRAPNAERVSVALTEAIRERERFCRLCVVFSSVLERNLSQEFIRDFKRALLVTLERFAETLQSVLPQMTSEKIREFLFQHHALIAGLWPVAHPSPDVSEILEDSEFATFRIDFCRMFQSTIRKLIEP